MICGIQGPSLDVGVATVSAGFVIPGEAVAVVGQTGTENVGRLSVQSSQHLDSHQRIYFRKTRTCYTVEILEPPRANIPP